MENKFGISSGGASFLNFASSTGSDNLLGNLIGDVSKLSNAVIEKSFNTGVENAYKENKEIVDNTFSAANGIAGQEVPKDIVDAGSRIDKLSKARRSGSLSDTQFWTILQSEQRKQAARHPGFADFVSEDFARRAGGDPAVKIRNAIKREDAVRQQEQRAVSAELRAKKNKEEERRLSLLNFAAKNAMLANPQQAESFSATTLRRIISEHSNNDKELKDKIDRQDAYIKGNKVDTIKTGNLYKEAVQKAADFELLDGAAGQAWQSIRGIDPSKSYTPEQTTAFRSSLATMRLAITSKINAMANTPSENGSTFAGSLGQDTVVKSIENSLKIVTAMEEALVNKETGLLNVVSQLSQARKDRLDAAVGSNKLLNTILLQKKVGGDPAVQAALGANGGKGFKRLEDEVNGLVSGVTSAIESSSNGTPLVRQMDNRTIQLGKPLSSVEANAKLDSTIALLLDKSDKGGVSDINTVNALFDLSAGSLVGRAGSLASAGTIYSKMTTPQIADRIAELENTTPGSMNKYMNFIAKTGTILHRSAIAELQSVNTTGFKWDVRLTKGNRIAVVERKDRRDVVGGAITEFVATSSRESVQKYADNVNRILIPLEYAIKKEDPSLSKEDVAAQVAKFASTLGVAFVNKGENSTLGRLLESGGVQQPNEIQTVISATDSANPISDTFDAAKNRTDAIRALSDRISKMTSKGKKITSADVNEELSLFFGV